MQETPTTEQVLAVRQRRKVKTGGSGCAALGFFLVGLLLMAVGLLIWPLLILGLLVFIAAFAVDAKHGYIYFCGHCGNDVAPTSQICPICRAQLVEDKKGWFGF